MKVHLQKVLVFVLLAVTLGFAQQTYKDVVYLKNGSIINGVIIETVPNVSIKLQTKDGNIFVFKYEEIEKLTKELVNEPKPRATEVNQSAVLNDSTKIALHIWDMVYLGLSTPTGDLGKVYNVGPTLGFEYNYRLNSNMTYMYGISAGYYSGEIEYQITTLKNNKITYESQTSKSEYYDLWAILGLKYHFALNAVMNGNISAGIASESIIPKGDGESSSRFGYTIGIAAEYGRLSYGIRYLEGTKEEAKSTYVNVFIGYLF